MLFAFLPLSDMVEPVDLEEDERCSFHFPFRKRDSDFKTHIIVDNSYFVPLA